MSGNIKMVPETGRELVNSPYAGIVGDVETLNVDMGGTVLVDGTAFMHAFLGTKDVSSTVLSGSIVGNGNVVTLKTIANESPAEYRYTFRVGIDGKYLVWFFRRKVERESGSK